MWPNNVFRMEEHVSSIAHHQQIFPAYNYKSYSPNYYTRKTWTPATTNTTTTTTNSYPSFYSSNTTSGFQKARQPPPPLPTHNSITNRLVTFHSSASWRAYFNASKTTNKLIVVDFTAEWCGPCRKMEPTIHELAAKYSSVDFAKIDVDNLFDVASEYGVQTMPTFLLFKNGILLDKVTGANKEELQMKIELN